MGPINNYHIFVERKFKVLNLLGSGRTGEDAGAGREESEQHRGEPLAETGDRGVRIQPREHCEYHHSLSVIN